ncbi:hypothetical protein SAMN05192589_107138 [Paracidovorax valerianellae]|uniref:Uncharacterized protein n=2 Tax=Paracidovorax valerianellae TaxID=187868 RepID=A0A1G6VTQ7_9BURK|nr:hypothetical protein SAMN05192589_107138 [Paracidovorax valerianellae]
MSQPCDYMQQPWFALLSSRCEGAKRTDVARQLGISGAALSQVLNGSGKYGEGKASTAHIASRVEHTFGRYTCPHLTEEAGGEPQAVSAEQCRAFAHRSPPTGSPRAMQHWQACRQCPHKAASAPPQQRPVVPRKAIPISVQPMEASDAV